MISSNYMRFTDNENTDDEMSHDGNKTSKLKSNYLRFTDNGIFCI